MDPKWLRNHTRRMAKSGKLKNYLKEWRGDLTLEEAAQRVADLAAERGLDLQSKKIPTSHAAISRLESGKVGYAELSLDLLAEVYGCHPLALLSRRPTDPPTIYEIYDKLDAPARAKLEGYAEGMLRGVG